MIFTYFIVHAEHQNISTFLGAFLAPRYEILLHNFNYNSIKA
jgi:predicted transcriptional regulator YheO